ncbi:thiosulfate reductase cytochrome B subunit [Limnobaculum eriocheiris]
MWLAAALLLILALHGVLRLIISKTSSGEWHKTYLYTLPVRVWHWLNALCFILLLVSGIAMHFTQGELATWADLHNITGLTLCAVWLLFIVVNLLGNGHHYVVKLNGLPGRLLRQTRYYLFGIFRREAHPEHPSAQSKFNPLQQLGYIGVMYLLVPLLIITGLLMLYPENTPDRVFGLPGKQLVAYTHYLLAAVSLLFLLVHLYLCTTGDSLAALLKGMIDGYHRHKSNNGKSQ